MQRRAGLVVIGTAVALAGCGGAIPALNPMGNSLTDGINGAARPQSSRCRV